MSQQTARCVPGSNQGSLNARLGSGAASKRLATRSLSVGSPESLPERPHRAEETRAAWDRRLGAWAQPRRESSRSDTFPNTRPGAALAPKPKLPLRAPFPAGQPVPRGSSCDGLVVALAAMATPEVVCVPRRPDGEFERARFRSHNPAPTQPGQTRPIKGRACDRASPRGSRLVLSFPGSEIPGSISVQDYSVVDRYSLSQVSERHYKYPTL